MRVLYYNPATTLKKKSTNQRIKSLSEGFTTLSDDDGSKDKNNKPASLGSNGNLSSGKKVAVYKTLTKKKRQKSSIKPQKKSPSKKAPACTRIIKAELMNTKSTKKTTENEFRKKVPPNIGVHGITKPAPGQGKFNILYIDSSGKSVDEAAFTAALEDAQKQSRKKSLLLLMYSQTSLVCQMFSHYIFLTWKHFLFETRMVQNDIQGITQQAQSVKS